LHRKQHNEHSEAQKLETRGAERDLKRNTDTIAHKATQTAQHSSKIRSAGRIDLNRHISIESSTQRNAGSRNLTLKSTTQT
jgi:hypothetical protein